MKRRTVKTTSIKWMLIVSCTFEVPFPVANHMKRQWLNSSISSEVYGVHVAITR